MITVKNLIKELKKMPQDAVVVIQEDSDGNGYRKCVGVDNNTYVSDIQHWLLDVRTSEDIVDCEEDLEEFTQVVVIYPS